MQAEQAKSAVPGAGLCPGFTISRAILADAGYLSSWPPRASETELFSSRADERRSVVHGGIHS
jgi:hypothetical protein